MKEKYKKLIIVAAASKAARFKSKNPKASEEDVIRYAADNAEKILSEIDEEEF